MINQNSTSKDNRILSLMKIGKNVFKSCRSIVKRINNIIINSQRISHMNPKNQKDNGQSKPFAGLRDKESSIT